MGAETESRKDFNHGGSTRALLLLKKHIDLLEKHEADIDISNAIDELEELEHYHARTWGLWGVDNKKILSDNLSDSDFNAYVFQIK